MQAPRGRRNIAPTHTSSLDAGEGSASRPGRALLPGKDPQYPVNTVSHRNRLDYLGVKTNADLFSEDSDVCYA
jgi:hypothetical protein